MKRLLSLVVLSASLAGPVMAQGFLLRVDSRGQSVAFRGVRLDSVPLASTVPSASGGRETTDGFAVDCAPGAFQCSFYRPGKEQRGTPVVTSLGLTVWGLGLPRLSLHANARAGFDLSGNDVWPGLDPAIQLLEGYADYSGEWYSGQIGRQIETGRLGYTGYDGAGFSARSDRLGLSGRVYAGLGLGRASALPVTSPALNPLDEFQPRQRQLVVGASGGWTHPRADLRFEYQREVDRDTRNFVSERVALNATFRPLDPHWALSGGSEYDLARHQWGTSDLTLRYQRQRWNTAAGVRYYRPYFDLWTIWGVFSPVGYTAVNWTAAATPFSRFELSGSAERYWYAQTHATNGLLNVEDRGWRWSAGAGYSLTQSLHANANYHAEYGAGAASEGWDGRLSWRSGSGISLSADGGHLTRPLEFRFNEAVLDWVGIQADLQASERLRLGLSATRYMEDHRRPDAAAFDWDQTRIVASVSWLFGSSADRIPLPLAIRRRGSR